MYANWIAVDWGTTNIRAWAIDENGNIFASAKSEKGMGKINLQDYESVMLELTGTWLNPSCRTDIIISGMAGAKTGWKESPYLEAPCSPLSTSDVVFPKVQDHRICVSILPGIKTTKPNYDVMRGEEIQIAGFLTNHPNFEGVVCLPGTHTKWVHVENGLIVSFLTFISGELYDLLANKSTLATCVNSKAELTSNEIAEFKSSVETGMQKSTELLNQFFGIRASSLLTDLSPEMASARLSGLIVGSELVASKAFWLGRRIVIIGESKIAEFYALSLALQSLNPETFDVSNATVTGLKEFRNLQKFGK